MRNIVAGWKFGLVDWDFNLYWIISNQLASIDELKERIICHDDNGELDGALGLKLFYLKECNCGNARNISGNDWYGFQQTEWGVNFLQTNARADVTDHRYPEIIRVRGKNTPDSVMCEFNKQFGELAWP